MSWNVHCLHEVADVTLGKTLNQRTDRGELLPYLANFNVRWGEVVLDNLRRAKFEPNELEKYALIPGDILICEGGEAGRCAIWKEERDMRIQNALHRVRPRKGIDNYFLYYLLFNMGRSGQFEPYLVGATIKHFALTKLRKIKVAVPPLPTQEYIADILSTYDNLIENNRRRIELLEKAAHLLYKEWFIKRRFPNHKTTPTTDGLPEGWGIKHLSEIVNTEYGFTETATQAAVGPKFLRGTDINKTSYIDWSTVPYCSINDQKFKKYKLNMNDILVIRMADPGKVAIVENNVSAVFASYLIRLTMKANINISPIYLFHVLSDNEYQETISRSSGGSTRKSANAKLVVDFDILVPPNNLIEDFVTKVKPIRHQIQNLVQINAILRKARDMLLPRFMAGKI